MTRNSPELSARAREIALELTSWPSVTGTPEEAAFSDRLMQYLRDSGHEKVWTEAIPGDALTGPRRPRNRVLQPLRHEERA